MNKSIFFKHVIVYFSLISLLGCAALPQKTSTNATADEAENPFTGEPLFDLQKPFFELPGKAGHWIPTITVAKDGSVLVFKDQRKKGIIEVFRSKDGGKSWGAAIRVGELVVIKGDTLDDGRYTDSRLGKSTLGNVDR